MKTILISILCLLSNYAIAQIEPKTSQGTTDTIVPQNTKEPADRTNIVNKGLLKRNTLESGSGKPDDMRRELPSVSSQRTIITDTIGKKKRQ